jgi:hypothetical protein
VLAGAQRGDRGRSRRGGTGGQGSPVAPVQRSRWCEYEDGEGKSPDKKDGAVRRRFFKGDGAVEAEGFTGIRLEESSLASTWSSGRRRAPARCSSK